MMKLEFPSLGSAFGFDSRDGKVRFLSIRVCKSIFKMVHKHMNGLLTIYTKNKSGR